MPVPRTNIHAARVVDQIAQNLHGLQRDMYQNALAHKSMAQAQAPDLQTLTTYVKDSAGQYVRRLQWVVDIQRPEHASSGSVSDQLAKRGWSRSDITDIVDHLLPVATKLQNAALGSYADVMVACDALLAHVDAPPSLWPE